VTPAEEGLASPLAGEMAHFLEHKRVLGRRFETEGHALGLFDRYLVEQGTRSIDAVTPEIIQAFVGSRPRHQPRSFNHLVGVLRRFFNWLVARDIVARSPVRTLLRRAGGVRRTPFIFAPEQARRLLDLAARLPDVPGVELRGRTYHAIFAVLYGLGLRVGEVCRLNVEDLDPKRHLLVIRDTKFGKDRLVPFGPQMGKTLERYLALRHTRDKRLGSDAPLFSGRAGGRLRRQQIGKVFRQLLPRLDLMVPAGASASPRVHDLRHSLAVRTLLRWYRMGVDPGQRLLHLSTFLGHVQPESTAVYLTITSELLAEAGGRFEAFARPFVRAVRQ
jgi:site-specific recombinase XerD